MTWTVHILSLLCRHFKAQYDNIEAKWNLSDDFQVVYTTVQGEVRSPVHNLLPCLMVARRSVCDSLELFTALSDLFDLVLFSLQGSARF